MNSKDKKIRLVFFGGIDEIGGNCVLLEDFGYKTKIIIDFGINFKKYFDSFDRENPSSLEELFNANLIPQRREKAFKNLYSKYFIFNHVKERFRQKLKETEDKTDPPTDIDGILISHPHRDHYYGLPLINRNIPIYTGVVTKKIILAHYQSSRKEMNTFYHKLKWKPFRTGDIIEIKGMKITPVHVDHSIPAAYGFIFNTSAGIIVYSGDFRMHGPLSYMTGDLILKVKKLCKKNENVIKGNKVRVKCLMCEGTHIHKGAIESEAIVKRHLKKLFKNMPFDYILVKYDRVDWDRFRTYVNIAKKFKWKYIISEKDAYFYYRLNRKAIYPTMKNPNIKKEDNIFIIMQEKTNYGWQKYLKKMLERNNKESRLMKYTDLKNLDGKFFLYITSLTDKILENLPQHLKGCFISSNIDPYAEHFRDNNKSIEKKLLDLKIPSYRIHASGHSKPHDIYKYIKEINPQNLIPIHTEHSEFFTKLFENEDINVISFKNKITPYQIELNAE